MSWTSDVILITGGTGSLGRQLVRTLLPKCPAKLILFSRDELKQYEMREAGYTNKCLRYFIGDVRDLDRLRLAMDGVDIVIHAAAMKQVPTCEYNPFEAVKTNVLGAQNVIRAAIDRGVKKVLAISTDKSVEPVNLYGATKLVAEKLFIQGNRYSTSETGPHFSCVRYGNVVGSRGSVVLLFQRQCETGTLTITDERMTRFWITLEQSAQFVTSCIGRMNRGEVFVPKIPSMKIVDLARAIAPDAELKVTGIRPGEKLHEVLISHNEAYRTLDLGDRFVVQPDFADITYESKQRVTEGFSYTSDNNVRWLTASQLREML